MLELNKDHTSLGGRLTAVTADEPSAAELFAYALGVVRRQMFIVLLFAMLGAGLGVVIFLQGDATLHGYCDSVD